MQLILSTIIHDKKDVEVIFEEFMYCQYNFNSNTRIVVIKEAYVTKQK